MTTEPTRMALYNRLGEVLGSEYADTLMSGLQMHGDLVTRTDFRAETAEIRAEMVEIREIHKAIHSQNPLIIVAMTALTGIFSVVVGLIT